LGIVVAELLQSGCPTKCIKALNKASSSAALQHPAMLLLPQPLLLSCDDHRLCTPNPLHQHLTQPDTTATATANACLDAFTATNVC